MTADVAHAGLVYLCFKHSVDRYNIYFVYTPSKTNKYIHATAIDFVIGSLILLQFTLAVFFYLRAGQCSKPRTSLTTSLNAA